MNNIKTPLYSYISDKKVKLAVISSVLWLCAIASWIYFCPLYLPDRGYLFFSNFESIPEKDVGNSQLVLSPWHYSTKDVILESEGGYEGSAGIKLMADGEKSSYIKWTLANPQSYAFLEFRGKMRSENIIVGENEWNAARFLVYFTDKGGKGRWDYPHGAVRLIGTHPWQEYSKIFPVPDFAVTANILIENSGRSGTIWCDDISLRPAHTNPSYFLYKNILSAAGIFIGIFLIFTTKLWEKGNRIILILLVTIILGAVCADNYLIRLAHNLHIDVIMVKKLGHLALFFLLGFVSTRWLGGRVETHGSPSVRLPFPILTFGGLLIFAAITEFLQFLTLDRNPSFLDMLIDVTGAIIGISLACVIKKPIRKNEFT